MKRNDITSNIQRIAAFEDRLNVKFEALSAFEVKEEYSDDHEIVVRGELHAVNGSHIQNDLKIELSIFDVNGRIIETSRDYVEAEEFFCFHTFEINCYVPPNAVSKLRLVPITS
ncbi:MAG: hypothetical protein KF851_08130 [Pirellulaceae bacterium]|nr:hypothetical protein [Pirellulaceae bacterium]